MRRTQRPPLIRTLLSRVFLAAGLSASAVLSIASPAPALGADASFGAIRATATFGTAVTFTEPAVVPDGALRVEVVIDVGSASTRSFVASLPDVTPGSVTLRYAYPTPLGGTLPNTLMTGHFRVTRSDRTEVDGPSATVRYEDTRFAWQTATGKVVRVHWSKGSAAFGQRALTIGDDAVTRISAFLGVTEATPVDFFVYPDRPSFYDVLGPGSRENVGGVAFPDIRTLFANIDTSTISDPWVGIVIPHELTHLVIETVIKNPYHEIPHWMNEGIAVYLSQGYDQSDRGDVASAVGSKTLLPLAGLIGQFPTSAGGFSLAYSESVSAIDYLVRTSGKGALVKLLRSYATGVTDDEAFRAALGVDVAGFEAGWLRDLGAATPQAYGPQAAPAGPVPSGWDGAAPTPGVVAGAGTGSGSSRGSEANALVLPLVLGIGFGLLVGLVLTLRRAGRSAASRTPMPPAPTPIATVTDTAEPIGTAPVDGGDAP